MEELKKKWLTVEELAEYLSIKKSTVYDWTHRKAIPHYKRGHVVRFLREDVDSWLEQYRVMPIIKELGNGDAVQKT
jgi:excisionase family DNA binding protein